MRQSTMRKFKPVAKKGGVPVKYTKGASNPSARRAEIKRTRRLYKRGLLTPAMMDKMSEERSRG